MTNDNFGRYKRFIIDIMVKYKELFPIAEIIYKGIGIDDGMTTSDQEDRLFRYELSEHIGINKHISDIIESPLWISFYLVAPKNGDEFNKHVHVLEKAMYNVVLSYYVHAFMDQEKNKIVDKIKNKIVDKMMNEL